MPSILQGPACQAFLRRPMHDPQRAARRGGCDEADFEYQDCRFPRPSWPSCLSGVPWDPGDGIGPGQSACRTALSVSTREIDLGVIGPGESARAQFQITNTGEGRIRWTIEEPPGWESSTGGGLTGECGASPSRVDVVLSSLKVRPEDGRSPGGDPDRIRKKLPGA